MRGTSSSRIPARYQFAAVLALVPVFMLAGASWGANFYASDATELQNHLSAAALNGEDDTIMVARGIYKGNFEYVSSEGRSITLQGGYDATFCSRQVDPAKTVLDGQSAGRVLHLYNSAGGSITVDGFTIRNGSGTLGAGIYARSDMAVGDTGDITLSNNIITGNDTGTGGSLNGGGVNIYSHVNEGTSANILVSDNIITGNTANYLGGGLYALTMSLEGNSGTVTFSNNIIAGNTAAEYDGGGVDVHSAVDTNSYTCGKISFYNNTIAGNSAGRYAGGVGIDTSNGDASLYNNIVWGNAAASGHGRDLHTFSQGCTAKFYAYYNDFSDAYGCPWTGEEYNISTDPLFVAPSHGNYHLRGNSPCRNAGIFRKKVYLSSMGMWLYYYHFIPDTDFEGDSRDSEAWIEETSDHYYKYCDIGADEFTPSATPAIPLLLLND
ncbi:MAG: hypothetical protein JRJ12_13875 [Deltaproteobacteria bacterium]|nr:hypothetical protein [Deltaproteobacteria bacterium]MBW2071414.1 hypothetical protein [Deltaproteobacteria bacterium]